MGIWEMKDKELACNMGILPSGLTKGRSRRISQMCPWPAEAWQGSG